MLEFARPQLLWAFASLLLVWLLHWVRGRGVTTDRLEIWERALRRVPRSRRRRLDARLLVSLLIAAMLALAAAGPKRPAEPGVRVQHVVVDLSPSMGTRDAGTGTRLDAARRALEVLRAQLPDYVPLRTWVLHGPAIEVSDVLSPGLDPARSELLPRFAELAGGEHAVWFFGDGAAPSAWPESAPANLRMRGFGTDFANDGILRCELEDPWPGPNLSLTLGLVVRSPGKRLVVRSADGTELGSTEVPPGRYERVLELPRLPRLRVGLEPGDAYAADDAVEVQPKAPLAPLVHAEIAAVETPALFQFLVEALGGRMSKDLAGFRAASGPRLWLQSGGRSAGREPGLLRVFFGTGLPGMGGRRASKGVCEWRRADPVLEGLDLSTISCERQRETSRDAFGRGARVLATLGGEPFVVLDVERKTLWFGGRLQDGNLITQPALPILILRALAEFSEAQSPRGLAPLPDPRENEVAARPAPGSQEPFDYYVPAKSYWPELLLAAAGLLILRLFLR